MKHNLGKANAGAVASDVEKIRAMLGHLTMQWAPAAWLDTGFPDLNEVLGCRDHGVPYGCIMELFGLESHGKTALAISLAAMAQQKDQAAVIWGDAETSYDPVWARKRGLDPDRVMVFRPYVGKFGREREARLSTAQELCEEIEAGVHLAYRRKQRIVIVLDSLTALLPGGEADTRISERNMRTNMDLPMFLGSLLRRWVGMVQSHQAILILINQMRQKPGAYGNPWYTPGGQAPRFYSHVRAKVRRAKGGLIRNAGKVVGIKGILRCVKNKAGGTEGSEVGYYMRYDGTLSFCSAKKLEGDAGESDED